jgi:hypothetical protein
MILKEGFQHVRDVLAKVYHRFPGGFLVVETAPLSLDFVLRRIGIETQVEELHNSLKVRIIVRSGIQDRFRDVQLGVCVKLESIGVDYRLVGSEEIQDLINVFGAYPNHLARTPPPYAKFVAFILQPLGDQHIITHNEISGLHMCLFIMSSNSYAC